jgi:hypothetical protein
VNLVRADVSEERVTSIFKVKEYARKKSARRLRHVPPKHRFLQDPHRSTSQKTDRYENLKSYIIIIQFPKLIDRVVDVGR